MYKYGNQSNIRQEFWDKANDPDQNSARHGNYGLKKLADGVEPTFECAN